MKPKLLAPLLLLFACLNTYAAEPRSAFAEEHTDVAQIAADIVSVDARVSGGLTKVLVAKDHLVRRGDHLAVIHSTEYRLRLQAAEAELAAKRRMPQRRTWR